MGLFDFFKTKKEEKQNYTYARMINGEIPIYSQFGDDIYASDVVNQALYSIVTEILKLNPKHIRKNGFDIVPVNKDVQHVLDNPNPLMTTCEYLEKITWNLLLHYNSFIYKQYDLSGKLFGLYPLQPTQVTFLDSDGQLFVKLLFKNGDSNILPYSRLIHIKSHFSLSDLMGGDANGQPNNAPLLSTLKLNDTLLNGVKKALNSSFAINGIVKYHTMIDDGTMAKNITEFENKLVSNQSGILGIDNKAEFIPISRNIQLVDEATLSFIDDKILRNFGVPIEIVRGNYTSEQYEAFYQKTIEPIVIAMSQAHTKSIFSEREVKGFKNEIKFYTKELIFMNTTQKLEMINLLGQTGTLYENEKRVAFGYEPLPELAGVRLQSLNWVDVKYAEKYQTGQQNTNTGTGNKAQGGEENE